MASGHRLSQKDGDALLEDYYAVKDEREVDHLNRSYTGMRLEYKMKLDFHILTFSVLPA